jgi:hypothetical protein
MLNTIIERQTHNENVCDTVVLEDLCETGHGDFRMAEGRAEGGVGFKQWVHAFVDDVSEFFALELGEDEDTWGALDAVVGPEEAVFRSDQLYE